MPSSPACGKWVMVSFFASAVFSGVMANTPPEIPQADPVLQNSEPMARASRSLLLDAVHTPAGYFVVGERGHVLVSDDAKSWRQVSVPTRATLTTITSIDGQLWAAGHDGVILHSADGGQSWTRRRQSPWSPDLVDTSEGVPVLDILFSDAQHGIAVGAYSLLLTTDDGGATWAPGSIHNTAPDEEGDVAVVSDDPAIMDDGAGEDGFSADDLALGAESDPHLNAITRVDADTLVITGERGTFLRSRDNGKHWENKRLPYEGSMFGVLAWGGEHILVYGLRGNVYESLDLGDTWQRVETGIGTSLMGGVALPGGGAVLVGANGAVLARPDFTSPFQATAYQTGNGETPLLSGVVPVEGEGYLLLGDKGVDLYQPH